MKKKEGICSLWINERDLDSVYVPINKVCTYHNHPFKVQEGAEMDELVQSIKDNGLLQAVLQKYEMKIILFGGAKNGLKEHGISPKEVNKDFVEEQRKIYYEKGHEISAIYDEIEAKEKEEKMLKELYEQLKKELHLEEQEKAKEKKRKRQVCL